MEMRIPGVKGVPRIPEAEPKPSVIVVSASLEHDTARYFSRILTGIGMGEQPDVSRAISSEARQGAIRRAGAVLVDIDSYDDSDTGRRKDIIGITLKSIPRGNNLPVAVLTELGDLDGLTEEHGIMIFRKSADPSEQERVNAEIRTWLRSVFTSEYAP